MHRCKFGNVLQMKCQDVSGRLTGSKAVSANGLRLCVRAGLLARMFKVSTAPRLTQNRCYKLAAVIYRKAQIEALNKRIKKKEGWK
jgi:hypothetical protein